MGCLSSKNGGGRKPAALFPKEYILGEQIGKGGFSVVCKATFRSSGKTVAVKIVNITKMKAADKEALKNETDIMKEVNHPKILKQLDIFEDKDKVLIVFELLDGGDLFDSIVAKTTYSEKEAHDVVLGILEGLQYLHSRNIVHCDLKPENLLLKSRDNAAIKLADFGFAQKIIPDPTSGSLFTLTNPCGTPAYVAPEIINRVPYGKPVDMWGVGVISYILLGGYPPFADDNRKELYANIKRGRYVFHPEYWGNVSEDAKDFIKKLLNIKVDDRLTVEQALQHQWIVTSRETLASRDLNANLKAFKKFNARRKFRMGVRAIVAAHRFAKLVGGLGLSAEERQSFRASKVEAQSPLHTNDIAVAVD